MINFSSATTCRRCKKSLGKGCPECGHPLPEEATFCSSCGAIFAADKVDVEGYKTKNLSTSLAGKEAETAETNKEANERKGSAFQPKVHRFTRCPECWSKISAEAKFCTFCGAKFSAPLAPAPEEKAKTPRPIPPQPKAPVPPAPKTPIPPQPKAPVPSAPKTPTPPSPKAPASVEPAKPATPTIAPSAEKPAAQPTEAVETKTEAKRQPPAPTRKIPVPVQTPSVEPSPKIAEPIKPPPVREEAPTPAAAPEKSAAEKPVPTPTIEEKKPEPAPPPPKPPVEPVVTTPPAAPIPTEAPPAATPAGPVATEKFEIVATELPDQPVMVPTHFPPSAAELGIELRRVEGGTYPHPQKPGGVITVKSFALSVTPVTGAQYHHFVQATGYRQPFDWLEGNPLPGKSDRPVICVSFRDAWTFCHWAGLRLPTDEEWMAAFSGRAGSRYPWGDQPLSPEIKEKLAGRKTAWPVGANPETNGPFGHQDLVANVRQWTLTPDPRATRQDDWPWPQGFIGLAGSSYLDPLEMAEYGQVYGIIKPDLFDFVIGFRCVADIEDP